MQEVRGGGVGHLPNSKIMAQISRALSTSLRFDPLQFGSGMTDTIKAACGIVSSHSSMRRGTQEPEEERRLKEREEAGRAERLPSAVGPDLRKIPPTEIGISSQNSS